MLSVKADSVLIKSGRDLFPPALNSHNTKKEEYNDSIKFKAQILC